MGRKRETLREKRIRAGRKGGLTTKARKLAEDPQYFSKIAALGGHAVKAKYGPEYLSRIGSIKKGEGKGGQQS